MKKLEDYVVTIPDFPEPGIMFRDVTSVCQDPEGFKLAIDEMQKLIGDIDFDIIAGAESRGFIFGAPIAYNLNKSLVLIRKKGKLPRETVEETYSLEYGTATIEMHKDAVKAGQKVLLVDDLMATGGTVEAMIKLVEQLGGEVPCAVIREATKIHEEVLRGTLAELSALAEKRSWKGECVVVIHPAEADSNLDDML